MFKSLKKVKHLLENLLNPFLLYWYTDWLGVTLKASVLCPPIQQKNQRLLISVHFWFSRSSLLAIFCIMVSWLVLGCNFTPEKLELREVTLLKFLYLYDPQSCGRLYLYNITSISDDTVQGNIVWPLHNTIAASFRTWVYIYI